MRRELLGLAAVRKPVPHAHRKLRELGEHVELRQRERRDPVHADGEPERDEVEPSAAPLPPVTVPNSCPSSCTRACVGTDDLARERPLADARDVRLRDTEHLVDPIRADPEAHGRAGRDRARRGDERIRAVIEVEQRALRALEEDALAVAQRPVDEERRVGDVRREPLRVLRGTPRRPPRRANGSSSYTRWSQTFFSTTASSSFWRRIFGSRRSWTRIPIRVALSAYAGPIPRRVVPIWSRPRRRSRAPSSATCHGMIRCAFPETNSRPSVSCPRDSRSSSSEIRTAGSTTQPAPIAERLPGDDPGRDLADLVGLVLDDDRVARVRATLVTADEVGLLGEQVDDLALALVAPLRADDDGRGHVRQSCTKRNGEPGERRAPPTRPRDPRTSRTGAGRRA